jgi:hypothetical protein
MSEFLRRLRAAGRGGCRVSDGNCMKRPDKVRAISVRLPVSACATLDAVRPSGTFGRNSCSK